MTGNGNALDMIYKRGGKTIYKGNASFCTGTESSAHLWMYQSADTIHEKRGETVQNDAL